MHGHNGKLSVVIPDLVKQLLINNDETGNQQLTLRVLAYLLRYHLGKDALASTSSVQRKLPFFHS